MHLAFILTVAKTITPGGLCGLEVSHIEKTQDLFSDPQRYDWLVIDYNFSEGGFGALDIVARYEQQSYEGNVWLFNSHRNTIRDGVLRTDFVYERMLLNVTELAHTIRHEQSLKEQFINARRRKKNSCASRHSHLTSAFSR